MPIAHKDLFETAGIRTTAGSRLYEQHVPTQDATLVAKLAAAGTVLLGKCNTHELGGGVTTINPFFGTTRNPWDRDARRGRIERRIGGGGRGRTGRGGHRQRHGRKRPHSSGVLRLRRLQADVRTDQHGRPARRRADVRSLRPADAHGRRSSMLIYPETIGLRRARSGDAASRGRDATGAAPIDRASSHRRRAQLLLRWPAA